MKLKSANALALTPSELFEVKGARYWSSPKLKQSARRNRLALDMPLIRRIADEEYVFLRLTEWVNKSLNFREAQIVFSDDPEADPDLELDGWMPASDRDDYMQHMFPWLSYDVVEYDEDGGAGEVASLRQPSRYELQFYGRIVICNAENAFPLIDKARIEFQPIWLQL